MASRTRNTTTNLPETGDGGASDWRVPVGIVPRTIGLSEPDAGDGDDTDDSPEARVLAMLRGEGGARPGKLQVYRYDDNGAPAYCADLSADEFESGSFALIRRRFGAGRYQLRLYGNKMTAAGPKFVILARPEVVIAPDAGDAAPLAGQAPGLDMAALVRELAAISQRQHETMMRAIEASRPPPVDPMANMRQMLELMTLMRAATGANATPMPSPIGEIVAAMRELRGAASELIPRDEPADPLASALPQVLDLVGAAMRGRSGAEMPGVTLPADIAHYTPAAPVPAPVAAPVAPPAPVAAAAPVAETPDDDAATFARIVALVRAGEVDQAAEALYEVIPDEYLHALTDPQSVALLVAQSPELADAREALERVRQRCVAIAIEEGALPAPTAPAAVAPAAVA